MKILSVNAGSSSLKFQMYEMPEEKVLISGYVEKIGQEDCFWTVKVNGEKKKDAKFLKNHTEAVEVLIDELFKNQIVESLDEIKGVGHRVLHGGEKYSDSVVITDEVIKNIEYLNNYIARSEQYYNMLIMTKNFSRLNLSGSEASLANNQLKVCILEHIHNLRVYVLLN